MLELRELLRKYRDGEVTEDEIIKKLRMDYVEKISDVLFDVPRIYRKNVPEVVYSEGKSLEVLEKMLEDSLEKGIHRIFSRCPKEFLDFAAKKNNVRVENKARIVVANPYGGERIGKVAVVSAGSSDIPVAEESAVVCEELGCEVLRYYDVGVSGIHRLKEPIKEIIENDVKCVICVAGMEGMLPVVLSSILPIPVVGVPTSVGYGVAKGGYSALTTMLSSCSAGLAVVNIDNGVGAALFASLVVRMAYESKTR